MRDLPESEMTILRSLFDEINRHKDWRVKPAEILNEWRTGVGEFETLYDSGVDDYTNDVSVRWIIADVLALAPPEALPEFRARVRELDDRFLAATRETNEPLMNHDVVPDDRRVNFYWYRIPRKVGQEFEEGLARQGIHRRLPQ